jgi:drug/metabolite transporter (DMT)-like permease
VQGLPGFVDWFLSTILIGLSVVALYRYGTKRRKTSWNPWIPLITGFGGYAFYLFPIMGFDFVQKEVKDFGTPAIVVLAIAGCIVGGAIAIMIRSLVKSKTN